MPNVARNADSATLAAQPPRLAARYELCFQSLFDRGRALVFPCDARGHVEMDTLSDRARDNYLYARAVMGREFGTPSVLPHDVHADTPALGKGSQREAK